MSGRNVTNDRIDQIRDEMSYRDQVIVQAVIDLRLLSGAQVRRLCFGDGPAATRAANRALKRLVDWGVLERLQRRIGGVRAGSAGFVYRLDRAAYRLFGVRGTKRYGEPTYGFVAHTLGIAEVLVTLTEQARQEEAGTCQGG